MKTNLHLLPLLLASIAAFVMTMTGYRQSPPKVPVRRRMSPLRLPWPYPGMAAMVAAILLPCAAISPAAALPPVIKPSSSFNSQSVFVGASATFTITATGDAPISYQWRRDGAELPGQTNKTLRIGSTQPANEGGYDVVVGNASGSVTSYVARLYAVPPTSELTKTNHTNAASLRLPYFYHLPTDYGPAHRYPLILQFTSLTPSFTTGQELWQTDRERDLGVTTLAISATQDQKKSFRCLPSTGWVDQRIIVANRRLLAKRSAGFAVSA